MKYLCTESEDGLVEVFTFPSTVYHDAMAEALRRVKAPKWSDRHRVTRTPISAGFVSSSGKCYGRSESLNLDSRPEDTEILASQR